MSSATTTNTSIPGSSTKQAMKQHYAWFMWLLAAMFYCYEFLLRVMPSVMMGYLERFYQLDIGLLGILASSYYFTYTPLQLIVGTLMDHYGVRRLLTFAVLACGLGCYLFGLNHHFSMAILGRMLIGAGSAFAFVGVLKVASDWLPHQYFALISGVTTALGMMGAISGELFVNNMFHSIGIKSFLLYLIIFSCVLSFLLYYFLKDRRSQERYHPTLAKEATNIKKDLVTMIRNKNILYIGLISLFLFAPTTIFADLWGISYLKYILHFSTHQASLLSSCVYLGWIIGAPISGYLSDYYHIRKTPLFIGSILASLVSLLLLYGPFTHAQPIGIILFLFGLFSSVQVLSFAIATDISPVKKAGTAIAITNMFTMLSGLLQIVVGYLLQDASSKNSTLHTINTTAFHHAFLLIPLCFLCAFALTFLLKETHGSLQTLSTKKK
jgi:MFS family permease